jgi:hypothetical protein
MNQLIICNTSIRQDSEGRYCLNDLHKAAGNEVKHKPANWLQLEQTKELILEIENDGIPSFNSKAGISALTIIRGAKGGTFVVKQLVYAYANWISAKFYLHVINTYDALVQMQHDLVKKATPKTKKMIEGCLTLEQQDAIKALVACRTEALPKEKKGKAVITLWSSIKSKYGLAKEQTYKDIPAEQFEQVLSLVARVPLEGEFLPKESLPSSRPAPIDYSERLREIRNDNIGFASTDEIMETGIYLINKARSRLSILTERVLMSEGKVKLA